MIDQKLIDRINELAHKAKNEGLTEEETQERAKLRQEYLKQFRSGFKSYLDSVDVVDQDGNKVDLKERKLHIQH